MAAQIDHSQRLGSEFKSRFGTRFFTLPVSLRIDVE